LGGVLTELHIENLGVIERAVLVLGPGMTALTGETGAGKTMLVEAIELLVGGRADATVVRHGASEARVDGRLLVTTGEATQELVLTRVIPTDGRSRAYVNGRPATVAHLAELTDGVIDLHGQHAHQSLLSVAAQRAALDEFGQVDLAPLRAARARITEIDAELATLGGDEKARAREIDLLRFQVAELDAAGIHDPDEDADLDRQEELLADAVAHRAAGASALEALRGEGGTSESLATALHALGHRQPFDELAARLRSVSAELDDIAAELRHTADAIEEDPERLAMIRERRQLLRDLRRKYGDDLAEVMAFHTQAEERLRELERYDQRAAELDNARRSALAAERKQAEAIGRRRRQVAPQLAAQIEQRLRTLAMPNASVAIEVGEHPDDHPGDKVTFLFSANPGSPLLPLSRVASGGELARAMLAVRLVLVGAGTSDSASALIFDEVDAGIGGAAAAAVGAALAELAASSQVLVVTHLPQVAACAGYQLVVDKTVSGGATFATVQRVDGEHRVGEIARMLSGTDSNAARQHARDLLQH
jgi:DNA repair protein RecN (Recombination protein N)